MKAASRSSVIVVDDVRKTYGDLRAVDGVSFEVGAGEFLGILGPNGAGKTTTLEIMVRGKGPEAALVPLAILVGFTAVVLLIASRFFSWETD